MKCRLSTNRYDSQPPRLLLTPADGLNHRGCRSGCTGPCYRGRPASLVSCLGQAVKNRDAPWRCCRLGSPHLLALQVDCCIPWDRSSHAWMAISSVVGLQGRGCYTSHRSGADSCTSASTVQIDPGDDGGASGRYESCRGWRYLGKLRMLRANPCLLHSQGLRRKIPGGALADLSIALLGAVYLAATIDVDVAVAAAVVLVVAAVVVAAAAEVV